MRLPIGKNDKTKEKRGAMAIRFPFTGTPIPQQGRLVERYGLNNPFAYASIVDDVTGTTRKYYLDEVPLTQPEAKVYTYILDKLESELTVPRTEVDPKHYFAEQARRIVAKYGIRVAPIPWSKILYFAERDLVGFGVLDALLRDPNIEDISVDGLKKPLFVYHRKYESLGTNVVFNSDAELDNLIARLAHMAGKHISTAFPILQGILPGRHRLLATFRREVSPYGSTMTIRKFREDPLTVVDLLNSKVLDRRMAAYMWLMMENKATALMAGSTGSGKTTLLNALLTLTRANTKIVTIEEVQEVNIPHSNWTALVSRESYGASGETSSQVGLFDLVKAAMRMRPDIIVVGEVRGEEAYVLFQAISTGHSGLCIPPQEKIMATIDGKPTLTSMGRLFSKEADTSKAVKAGDLEIAPCKGELLVPSYDIKSNQVSWERVKRFSRRRYAGKLLRFKVRGGNQATVTTDHPMLTLRAGKISRVRACEVAPGDLIPCVNEIPQQFASATAVTLDLIEEVQRRGLSESITVRFVKDLLYSRTKGQLASLFQVRYGAIDDYRRKDYLPFTKYIMLRDEKRNLRSLRFRRSDHDIPAVIQLTRDLARLVGFYVAEGHADEYRVDFSFNVKERELITEVEDSIAKIFGLHVRRSRNNNAMELIVKDMLVSWVFRDVLSMGTKSENKRLPALAFSSPPEFAKAILDAYFLGDGSAFVGKDRRVLVQAITASTELAYDVYYLMLMLGYQLNLGEDKRYDNWELTVSGGENLRKFVENFDIGSRLRGLVVKGNPVVAEKVPIEYALTTGFRQLLKTKQNEGNRFVSKQVIERLGLSSPHGVFFSEVTAIGQEAYEGYVYDLYEVENSHNFVHGFGVVTSNCTLHADDVESGIQRLTSKPMDVPPSFIPFLNMVLTVRRISIPLPGGGFRAIRRIVSVDEVSAVNQYFNIFKWNPGTDTQRVAQLRESPQLSRLARDLGISLAEIIDELNRRAVVIGWLQEMGVRDFRQLSAALEEYLAHPKEVMAKASRELRVRDLVEAAPMEGFRL